MRTSLQQVRSLCVTFFFTLWSATSAHGYAFNEIVPDVRQPVNVSGGSACPIPSHQLRSYLLSLEHGLRFQSHNHSHARPDARRQPERNPASHPAVHERLGERQRHFAYTCFLRTPHACDFQ